MDATIPINQTNDASQKQKAAKGEYAIHPYVYVHLHPVGAYSMASQEIIQNRIKGNGKIPPLPDPKVFRDSINRLITRIRSMSEDERNAWLNTSMKGMASMQGMDGMVTFPYAFPSPGNYRIWIQMKRDGKILNSAFDAVVE